MNIQELLILIRKRLKRKLRKAEESFINENSIKKSSNCVNRGRSLGDHLSHCKINALGSHESGASQCWNEKASICPYFERKKDDSQLRSTFRKMDLRELEIRWPSIGELLLMESLLSRTDEYSAYLKENSLESNQETKPSDSSGRLDSLQTPEESGAGSFQASVLPSQFLDGSIHGQEETSYVESEIRESDSRGPEDDRAISPGLPLAPLGKSGDRSDRYRAKIRPTG